MKSIALIVSLNFNPGHVSHMLASYRQLEELGYESVCCVDSTFIPFLPKDVRICIYGKEIVEDVSLALFLFPSQKNLVFIRQLKRKGSKVIYIFHEPLAPLSEYRHAGFSYSYLIKLWIINRINSLTVKWSNAVLLPSKRAVFLYESNPLYKNENHHYLPLLFADERSSFFSELPRKFFGYIGTVAADHSFKEYICFVEWAVVHNRIPELHFLIATKSDFVVPQVLKDSSRVTILKGRPLSNDEINKCYASCFLVWNAYTRTTQSGVLAKSFMFGTPVIVLRKNTSEFTREGRGVVFIDDNKSFQEIEKGINLVLQEFDDYSTAARAVFESVFFYRQYNSQLARVLDLL